MEALTRAVKVLQSHPCLTTADDEPPYPDVSVALGSLASVPSALMAPIPLLLSNGLRAASQDAAGGVLFIDDAHAAVDGCGADNPGRDVMEGLGR